MTEACCGYDTDTMLYFEDGYPPISCECCLFCWCKKWGIQVKGLGSTVLVESLPFNKVSEVINWDGRTQQIVVREDMINNGSTVLLKHRNTDDLQN